MIAKRLGNDVVAFSDLMPEGICSEIITAAERGNNWHASKVVLGRSGINDPKRVRDLISVKDPARNCDQSWLFNTPDLAPFERRIYEIGSRCLQWWDEHMTEVPFGHEFEQAYVVRYRVGQQFRTHTDIRRIRDGHIRLLSIVLYLNESKGGDLVFPRYGIKIRNTAGVAAMFPSGDTHLHTSNMVIGGTKYSIPLWVHYPVNHPYCNLKRRAKNGS